MDDSFPFILINKNEVKKGTLKELTMLELENETKRLFPSEFSRCTMEYIVDDDNSLPLEEDDDIDTEWAAINPESDSDSDESDDEDREEEKPKTPLRIKVIFTQKKIEIPQPVAVRVANIKSTTAVFQWKISARHNLNETQISSLQFEIQQISPSLNKNNIHHNLVAKCNPIVGSDKCYQIKLSGLHPITNYKFMMRSVLEDSNESIYSVSCDPFDVETTKDILMKPNQIPTNIEPPSDLQVIALYPKSATLAWNHTAIESLKQYDFEYYIEEQDVFAGGTAAATEDNNVIHIEHLMPSTQYTFVCKAKYYDPERQLSDIYYQNNQIISPPTNAVTITTPEEKTEAKHYSTRSIDKARWVKRGNQLELFWSAPESFYGRIEYILMDKIQNKVLGTAHKLPVTISTDDNTNIFGTKTGKFVITVQPIYIDGEDEKAERVEAKPYDIQITIDDEKQDVASVSTLQFTVRFESKDMQRSIKINATNCDFHTFKHKLFEQFKLNSQKLKISIRIPHNNALETMDISSDTMWQSFIHNHSEAFLRQNKSVYCFIETMMDAPSYLEVKSNTKLSRFEIDFKSEDAQKYCGEVQAKRDQQSTTNVDLGQSYNYVQGADKPLTYVVQSQHKYFYFRFRVKGRNPHIDSVYSQWTEWNTLNIDQIQSPLQASYDSTTYNYNQYPSSMFPLQQTVSDQNKMKTTMNVSPLQSRASPLQSEPSAINNYNVSGDNQYQQQSYNYNYNDTNNMDDGSSYNYAPGGAVLSGVDASASAFNDNVVSNDNNQNSRLSQFEFPSQPENIKPDNSASLNDLEAGPGGDNKGGFWENW